MGGPGYKMVLMEEGCPSGADLREYTLSKSGWREMGEPGLTFIWVMLEGHGSNSGWAGGDLTCICRERTDCAYAKIEYVKITYS